MAATAAKIQNDKLITIGDSKLHLHLDPDDYRLDDSQLLTWIRRSAEVVTAYYGRFPVKEAYIALLPVTGRGVKNGKAFGYGEATLNINVGRDSEADDLKKDWIMVHEMVHLAFPKVPRNHHWIEEGLAVYVESIARAQAGDLTAEFVWSGFVRGMPHGLPKNGDLGLDQTPTWGRTYWGGGLFCLIADVEIRKQTDNKKSLRDALKAIVDKDISMLSSMQLIPTLEIGDQATGTKVLVSLYQQMRGTAVDTNLENLWQELGVNIQNGEVVFNDRAPLAYIRRAMTAPLENETDPRELN